MANLHAAPEAHGPHQALHHVGIARIRKVEVIHAHWHSAGRTKRHFLFSLFRHTPEMD